MTMTKDKIRFEYRCENEHYIGADVELSRCPACILGEPCPGTLKRVGEGSRGPRR